MNLSLVFGPRLQTILGISTSFEPVGMGLGFQGESVFFGHMSSCFENSKKTFDRVYQAALWATMRK